MWMGSQAGWDVYGGGRLVVWSSGGTVGQAPRSTFCGMEGRGGGKSMWRKRGRSIARVGCSICLCDQGHALSAEHAAVECLGMMEKRRGGREDAKCAGSTAGGIGIARST